MAFTPGQSVMYNSICSTIIKLPGKRLFNPDATGYFIRENKSGKTYDNIPESELMNCSGLSICNEIWPDFIYTNPIRLAGRRGLAPLSGALLT